MNVELSDREIETLCSALDAWAMECVSSAAMGGLLSSLLSARHEVRTEQDVRSHIRSELADAEAQSAQRKRTAAMLKARLYLAQDAARAAGGSGERTTSA